MSYFLPGKVVKEVSTKKGRTAQLIYPRWELVDQAHRYINELSAEDTFISFSGEELSLKDEAQFLASIFVKMEMREAVFLFCVVDEKLVGICGVEQVTELRLRSKHIGSFGLSIGKEYRGEGLGYELAKTTIEEAGKNIQDLQLILLKCFANNPPALALYKKLGFVQTGQTPSALFYKGEYVDEVEMVKKL